MKLTVTDCSKHVAATVAKRNERPASADIIHICSSVHSTVMSTIALSSGSTGVAHMPHKMLNPQTYLQRIARYTVVHKKRGSKLMSITLADLAPR